MAQYEKKLIVTVSCDSMNHAMLRWQLTFTVACVVFTGALSQTTPARAEPQGTSADAASREVAMTEAGPRAGHPSVDEICHTLTQAAADNKLPTGFLTRLIWQESRFDPAATSSAGAQGIAQFMPQTAAMRGLANAFEPLQALRESASYLRELRTTFRGNLGLAAAAYNAGPGQVEAWLAGRSPLPAETLTYVLMVTGYTAQAWASQPLTPFEYSNTPPDARCLELAKRMTESVHRRLDLASGLEWGPWGVQLDANWSLGGVLAAYERLRRRYGAVLGNRLPRVLHVGSTFVVRVSEKSQTDANTLCAKLRASGGACIVLEQRAKTVAPTFLRASTGGVATLSSHAPKPASPTTRRIVVQPNGRPLRRGDQHRRRCKLRVVRAAPHLGCAQTR
jgi:Transglycosylase SLT domain/SPOR domain